MRSSLESFLELPGMFPARWQVFGLAGWSRHQIEMDLPAAASQALCGAQCFIAAFVPAYRCGAAPEFHRVPSCADGQKQPPGQSWSDYFVL